MLAFAQYLVGSLGFGGVYALAALGLVLIYKTSGVVNFAFGALSTVVTLVLWTALHQAGWPLPVSWLAAAAVALALGAVVERALLERIEAVPVLIQIVLTLGLLLLVEGLAGVLWGYEPKSIPAVLSGRPLSVGGLYLQPNDLFIVGVTGAVALALWVVLERTRLGLAMRAVAYDREIAQAMGIRARRFVTASWALGVLITSLAAILVAPAISLSPSMMDNVAVFAFAAAILGGFGSLPGAVLGGFLIGGVANLIAAYVSADLQLSLVFLLIVVLLYVRPQGLLGRETATRQ